MKRTTTVLCAAVMAFALTACNRESAPPAPKAAPATPPATTTAPMTPEEKERYAKELADKAKAAARKE